MTLRTPHAAGSPQANATAQPQPLPKSWKLELMDYLRTRGQHNVRGQNRIVGNRTQEAREQSLFLCFKELTALGYAIRTLDNFREKHVRTLVEHWEAKGLSASTIQCRLSALRDLARHLNKSDMVGPTERYVVDKSIARRRTAAEDDHSWAAFGIDADALIGDVAAFDPVVGMQLRLMHAFFLRREEAVMIRPHRADNVTYLSVVDGTKGGRQRVVDIDTDYQRQVLEQAKTMAKNRSGYMTGEKPRTLQQALSRFDYVCRRFGIYKMGHGITSHGLRHQGLNDYFERLAGRPSPVRGGGSLTASDPDEQARIDYARRKVSEAAGHARLSISTAYLGGRLAAQKHTGLVPESGATNDPAADARLYRLERLLELEQLVHIRALTAEEQEEKTILARRLADQLRPTAYGLDG